MLRVTKSGKLTHTDADLMLFYDQLSQDDRAMRVWCNENGVDADRLLKRVHRLIKNRNKKLKS